MITNLTFFIIAAVLFCVVFVSKRRFGLLGLALAAGSILSSIWGVNEGAIMSALGLHATSFVLVIVRGAVVLLPAVVAMFYVSSYKKMFSRLVGAMLFTVLALAFLIEPLGNLFVISGQAADIYKILSASQSTVIGLGLAAAVVDLGLARLASAK